MRVPLHGGRGQFTWSGDAGLAAGRVLGIAAEYIVRIPRLQFTLRRLLFSTAWFGLAALLLTTFPGAGYPGIARLLAFVAAAGAGAGALAGRPVSGALLAVGGFLAYGLIFPDRRP